MVSILSAASGTQRAYTIMYIRGLVPISLDVPRHLTEKIDHKKLDLTRMVELHIEGLEGTPNTLIAYSKALKQKVRLVIWVMMKENGMPYSMDSFKEIMASTYIAKLIFDKCRSIPNRKLISYTIKELFGWQRKAA